jgi:hypothetical protein
MPQPQHHHQLLPLIRRRHAPTKPQTTTLQALDADTFRNMARMHPEVGATKELRASLLQLRLADLVAGADGRNRCMLSAYQAKTGRRRST